jgi:hypothetical protein
MASRFSMATLKWTNGAAKARKRLPEDIRSEYQALYGQVSEVKFHRPAGTPPEKAKAEFAAWLAEVEGRIAALRESKGGKGVDLTQRQADVLAGDWYRWFTSQHLDNPGGPKFPRRVHIADTQGLLDCKSTDSSAPTMTMGAINGRNKQVDAIEGGHLLRFDKQMALRGNARHFDQDGICGEQKLVCCGDTKRLLVNLGRMYPGAKLVNGGGVGASTPRGSKGGKQTYGDRVLAFLAETTLDVVKTTDLPLGRPWNEIRRDVVTPGFKASLGAIGWAYGGKGRAAAFYRSEALPEAATGRSVASSLRVAA